MGLPDAVEADDELPRSMFRGHLSLFEACCADQVINRCHIGYSLLWPVGDGSEVMRRASLKKVYQYQE